MLTVDEAIRIAKIIEYSPENRLPLIVDVFNQAGVDIKALSDASSALQDAMDVKVEELLETIQRYHAQYKSEKDGLYKIPTKKFSELCQASGLEPYKTRARLAQMGLLIISRNGGVTNRTTKVKIDGVSTRCVILRIDDE